MSHGYITVRLTAFVVLLLELAACRMAGDHESDRAESAATRDTARTAAPAPSCGAASGNDLAVFVGQKRDVRQIEPELPPGAVAFDNVYRARYAVVHVLCGDITDAEVEFDAADHYGQPGFSQFETVLLVLARHAGRWYHEKYQFQDVYETTDGSWSGCGDPYKYEPEMHRGALRARPVTFRREVSFPLQGLTETQIAERYPPDYFDRVGDRVVCKAGAPLADLFAAKRDGVLRARELFR